MAFCSIFGQYAKMLFGDKCDIYVKEKSVNDYGESIFLDVLKESDVPCRINHDGERLSYDKGVYKGEYTVSIIFPPDICIPKGAFLDIEVAGEKRIFYATGESVSYISHKEVKAVRREGVF